MIWVLDASVAIRWFIIEESHPRADQVLERMVDDPTRFAVPELFPFEVFSVLVRLHPQGLEAFQEGVIPLLQSGMLRHPMTVDLARQATRFVRMGLTGYDACYAALAEDLGGVWITYDDAAHRRIQKVKISCNLGKRMPLGW